MSKTQTSQIKGAAASKVKPARGASGVKPQSNKTSVVSAAGSHRVSKWAGRSAGHPANETQSKRAAVLDMLHQPEGLTIDAMVEATGWQKHSVRGFLSAVVRKKLGLLLTSEKIKSERRYRIEAPAAGKPNPSSGPSRRAKTASQHAV